MSQANPSGVAMHRTRKRRGTMDWLIADAVNATRVAPVDPSWVGAGTPPRSGVRGPVRCLRRGRRYVVAVDRSDRASTRSRRSNRFLEPLVREHDGARDTG